MFSYHDVKQYLLCEKITFPAPSTFSWTTMSAYSFWSLST